MEVQENPGVRLTDGCREYVAGTLLFPMSNYLMNRQNIIPQYRKLCQSQWYSKETLLRIQLGKIRSVVYFANRWIPYYRDVFKRIGLVPGDIQRLEDVKKIPFLTRQDVVDHHREMIDMRLRLTLDYAEKSKRGPAEPIPFAIFRKHKLVRNTSSGSTGAPIVFYENGSKTALNWAHELRFKNWYGLKPGAKEARMARLSTDYFRAGKAFLTRKYLWNQLVLPGINLDDEDYEFCLAQIREFQPKILWGFTSALTGLADYVRREKEGENIPRPNLVMTWAAPLYDHERILLKNVFNASITNIYGAREIGHIAALCPCGSFHINQEDLLVETDGSLSEMTGDDSGEILVTTLDNSPMPFIRYRMGDMGAIAGSTCACGRSLQVLNNFLGRTGEVFITKDNRMISPNFWCRTFMNEKLTKTVKRFQVIYKRNDHIIIRIVRYNEFSLETKELLMSYLRDNFSSDMKISIEYVENLEPQISGKYQMVINESLDSRRK
jgi:phenylacetate-coenzyme A ligase PaaK-like adenylate-forming protein